MKAAFARTPATATYPTAVAFQFPGERPGGVHLFRLPDLDELPWRFETTAAPTASAVGLATDEDAVYTRTTGRQLLALDLLTGRARVADTNVALATIGPSGLPYVVRFDGSIATIDRRTVVPWSSRVEPLPRAIWPAARDRLVALIEPDSTPVLTLLADGLPAVSQRLPAGPLAVSLWGDVAAVGTDSGLVVLNPSDPDDRQFRKVRGGVGPIIFSPSAHRIYAATPRGRLLALERFDLDVLDKLDLPGPGQALRIDPSGRTLLVRPATQDSVWIVTLFPWRHAATVAASWDDEFPGVAPDGTVLVRQGDDIVALDREAFTPLERVTDPEHGRWLLAKWDPRRPELQLAQDSTPSGGEAGGALYVQVSSTRNRAWAEDFARNLQRAGIEASVLPPTVEDELYRVVLGPYPTREAAEAIGRRLGLPFWITSRDTASTPP